jgi:serine protease AprX
MSRRTALLAALLLVAGLVPANLSTAHAKADDLVFDPVDLSRLVVQKKPQTLPFPSTDGTESASPLEPGEKGLFVVQFQGVINDASKEAMRAVDAEVGPYVGAHAFAVRLTSEAADKLATNPLVAQVLRFQPSWKVAPSAQSGENLNLRVQTFGKPSRKAQAHLTTMSATMAGENRFLVAGASAATVQELAALDDVLVVEAVPKEKPLNDVARAIMKVSTAGGPWAKGLTGQNQVIGIADTGLDTGNSATLHPDLKNRLLTAFAYGRPGDWSDPNGHGTHVAGSVLGDGTASNGQFKGVAPAAKTVFQSMLGTDGYLYAPEGSFYALADAAYGAGARIHTNSWGHSLDPGQFYDFIAQEADAAVWDHRDMTVLFAAGNAGPGDYTIASPGVSKNVITVGASESERTGLPPYLSGYADDRNEIASFSSRGPTLDGRIKPDIVAPGTLILSTRSARAPDDSFNFPYTANPKYAYMSGTSMATPFVAGAAALTRQFYQQKGIASPSAALIKATLINGAQDMGYGWGAPQQGWGRVDLTNSLYPVGRTNWFKEEGTGLWPGADAQHPDIHVFDFDVSAGGMLKATLAWTDPPGSTLGGNPLVNDLDLAVEYPDGSLHWGNCFLYQSDTPRQDCNIGDGGNTVENVYLATPAPGPYRLYVVGYQIVQGPQPYALIVSGKGLVNHPDTVKPILDVHVYNDYDYYQPDLSSGYASGRLRVIAATADNLGIDRATLTIDGTLVPVSSSSFQPESPVYTWNWDTRALTGTKRVVITAYDYSGNSTSTTYTVAIDNQPPTLSALSPAADAHLRGRQTVSVSATDNLGVAYVGFDFMDEHGYDIGSPGGFKPPYSWTYDLSAMHDGPWTLLATALDRAGLITQISSNYIIDNTPPTVQLTGPAPNAVLPGGIYPLSVDAGDNYSVTKVEYWVDNAKKGEATTAPFTWSWNTAGLKSGAHTVMAKAYDAAGNVTTDSRSVTLDTVLPSLTVAGLTAGASVHGTQHLTATASDSSGITGVEFRLDGDPAQSLTTKPYTWDWETTVGADGPHTILVRASDAAGNIKESATSVTVDNTAPAISLNLDSGALLRNGAVLLPTATDNLGIKQVEFLVDGQLKSMTSAAPYTWTVAGLAKGDHTIVGRVTDKAGNVTATAAIPVTADSVAPANVALSGLTANSTIRGARPLTIAGKDDLGVVRAELWVDGKLNSTYPTTLATPLPITWDTIAATDGKHTVQAMVYDGAGNVTATSAVSVTVDNHEPVLGAITPVNGASIRATATITATATDAIALAAVEFWVDGTLRLSDPASPYSLSLATAGASGLSDGDHNLRVRAIDKAGNAAETSLVLRVDNTAPTVQLTTSAAGSLVGPGPVTLTAAATDGNAVNRVEFYVGSKKVATVLEGPYSWNWDAGSVTSGNYALKAVAVDAAGNATTSALVNLTVDTTKPAVAYTKPSANALLKGMMPVTATATDAHGPLTVTLLVDGAPVDAPTAGPFTWDLNTALYADGSHTLTVRAVDALGNVATLDRAVFFDNSKPIVSFTTLTDQSPIKPGAQVRITTTDASGVAQAQYYLDGAPQTKITTSPFAWTLPSRLSIGNHTLRVVVTDKAGWTGESDTITIVVDSTPPTLTVLGIQSLTTVQGTVSVTASSPDSDTVRIEFWVGTTLAYSAAGGSATWDWNTLTVLNGSKTIKVIAYDAAGNATTQTFTSVRVRN